jgi:hypothetical protein
LFLAVVEGPHLFIANGRAWSHVFDALEVAFHVALFLAFADGFFAHGKGIIHLNLLTRLIILLLHTANSLFELFYSKKDL